MLKKVFSIITVLALVLSALPASIVAAEDASGVTPTRIQSEELILTDEAAWNEDEGWKWTPDPAGGGTLELENCYIQSETTGILYFNNITEQNRKINIVLRGRNILETTSQIFNSMINANSVINNGLAVDGVDWIISEDGEGSLETRTKEPVETDNSPYAFAGNSITVKSGTVTSSVVFCSIDKGFYAEGGCFSLKTPEDIEISGGIYTINGPVKISGGKVDINSYIGIFIPGNTQDDASEGGQRVDISGGEVNIRSKYVGIFINQNYMDGSGMQAVNISGGKVDCEGGAIGFYCKDVNISEGGDTVPQVNVSSSQDSKYPVIYPRTKKVNISGGILTASGGVGIYGYDSQDSTLNNCIVFNGSDGKVYGTVNVTEDLELPENSVLTVPENAGLTIPEGVVLTVPDSSSVQLPENVAITNNGKLVLPEGSSAVNCTGTGVIQKGDGLYTNDNKRICYVTIRQNGKEIKESYLENDVVTFSPDPDTEDMKFQEWKVVSGAAVIEKGTSYFTMPAEDVIIEAVFGYKLLVKQPGGSNKEYYIKDSAIKLEPEDAGEDKLFKEWKVTPEGAVQIIDNKFNMPAHAVTAEAVYEQLYKVTVSQNGNVTENYYREGSTIQLEKEPAAEGMEFKEWRVSPGTVEVTGDSFTMPGYDVSVEAVYGQAASGTTPPAASATPTDTPSPSPTVPPAQPSPSPTVPPVKPSPGSTQKPSYPVVFPPYVVQSGNIYKIETIASPTKGGTVTGSTEAKSGDSVTVEAVPEDGYVFIGWNENGRAVSTDMKYTFRAEMDRKLIAVFKKAYPESAGSILKGEVNVTNNIKTVSAVSLPDGWEWDKNDSQKAIPAGGSVTAVANYTASDAGDYVNTSLNIIITRDKCVEDLTVLYTGDGEYAPGCVSDGKGHTECSLCGSILNTGIKVPATGHAEGQPVITKASIGKNGSIVTSCTKCNKVLSETVVNAIKTVKLSDSKGVYNKKKQHPGIIIKDSSGKKLVDSTDYTVSWAKGMKKPGIYIVKITFNGMYSGEKEKTYKIIPEGTYIQRIKPAKKGFNVRWKKPAAYVTGCQLQYSTDKKFKKKNTKKTTIKNKKTISKFIGGQKPGRRYYVRIRTYKSTKVNGKTVKVFSKWSGKKTVRIKNKAY